MTDFVLPRAAVRELDRRAIEDWGYPSFALMELAGRTCALEAEALLAGRDAPVVVLAGPGNNGGDGLVVARHLAARDFRAAVVLVGPTDALERAGEDVRRNAALWESLGGELHRAASAESMERLAPLVHGAGLVVDALFGTGLARTLSEPFLTAVRLAAEADAARLAVDLPSGLDADTGQVLGACAPADMTITFIARKPGFALGRGPELTGRVVVEDLGLPRAWLREAAAAQGGPGPCSASDSGSVGNGS